MWKYKEFRAISTQVERLLPVHHQPGVLLKAFYIMLVATLVFVFPNFVYPNIQKLDYPKRAAHLIFFWVLISRSVFN